MSKVRNKKQKNNQNIIKKKTTRTGQKNFLILSVQRRTKLFGMLRFYYTYIFFYQRARKKKKNGRKDYNYCKMARQMRTGKNEAKNADWFSFLTLQRLIENLNTTTTIRKHFFMK